ncbi:MULTISPECIES: sigma 54-interacting transcriptional regulator [unclassified Lysinibacillus]|uniref:sigma-54 interaction domain-containing protein n=1 Tax=unclassified Lysinibacillus TaxID=2636778 RepID=UPI0020139AE2|nr:MULTISPECIES: sigma 54-interacting transcriptional regulator [unclassified Lysinibacillus]MCL1696705.1 sigma 54-interacting transcriptional regulator [Lysinibacillus sp. BPa_S21]MCL1698814.1 sigma 54-interacting transcriptional regulator [Lysinibacillus sp. Bpr_S20]
MELTLDFLVELLDYASDEIYVLDKDLKIIFVNKACERHYGLRKDEVLGKHNDEFLERGFWKPSIIPSVLENEDMITLKQRTFIGKELLTRAYKIRDDHGELRYILCTATDIHALERRQYEEKIQRKEDVLQIKTPTLVFKSKKIQSILDFCKKIAKTDTTILIHGESGTGKGVFAKYIHAISTRANQAFVSINCASLPVDLVESELFGYESGAFTGAKSKGKEGLFSIANGGTIFLDEIGELHLSTQAKLLQAIQEKTFMPIGSTKEKTVDVRIITATNRDLWRMVEAGTFREDLFYRLNVIDIEMPPLRERKEDVLPLIYSYLHKFNEKFQMSKTISDRCISVLTQYEWPGNVRQLENLMERLVLTSDYVIDVTDLPDVIMDNIDGKLDLNEDEEMWTLDNRIEIVTKQIVEEAYQLKRTTREVAKYLGISQSRATRLIQKYKINENL